MIIFSSDYKRLISPFWSLQICKTTAYEEYKVYDKYSIKDIRDNFIIAEYKTEAEAVEALKAIGRDVVNGKKFHVLTGGAMNDNNMCTE